MLNIKYKVSMELDSSTATSTTLCAPDCELERDNNNIVIVNSY